ncbi:hypothetical protein [Agromyces atrinae]|uniref:Uncharacterized protein n=1 Tax=Agromyces atrinae TaxID=592376 RepID=A0A4V1R2S0_9MICO|nr:hypothetical protein [Agromyces atrinae]NYD67677.1 hypothetical protein [Agromyces atrinae]RXZ88126.1 hypothetical protein ESP50_02770 [Agromyces atrinae]
MTATPDIETLTVRLKAVEAENAALARRIGVDERPRGGWWRSVASTLIIVIATILVPVSIVGAWTRAQLVEEEAFVSTLAPIVDDPAVQQVIIDETMTAVRSQVDFVEVTDAVFDGIIELGMDDRAAAALGLLRQPAAAGMENIVSSSVAAVIESEAFSDVFEMTLRGAHRALTLASTSDGGGVVVLTPDNRLGIAVGPLVEGVKTNLTEQGIGVASLIPVIDRTIIVGSGESLIAIRTGYAVADAVGWWLPVVTLVLFGLGIALARRRSVAVLGSGLGIGLGAASLGATLGIGSLLVASVASQLALSPSAIDVIYTQLIDDMRQTAWIFALVGLIIALVGWVTGRSRAAGRLRRVTDSLTGSARRSLATRGLQTGAFGRWLGRYRVGVRIGLGVLAVVVLFAMRPLTVGHVIGTLIVALLVLLVAELLQRRPDDVAPSAAPAEGDG